MKLIAQFPPTDPLVTLQEASEGVYVLQMHHGADNRFNRPFCQALLDALTHVEQLQIPAALITVGQTKFFSNGLALDQVLDDFGEFQTNYYGRVLLRWLTSPLVTIAALNGHAFAGGMIFAMANDYRIMRQDRGFLCMNEVDMPAPLSPGMCATIRMRFSNMQAFRDCILEAKRFNAKESLELGLVDDIVGEKDVLTRALALGEKLKAKSTPVYGQLKEEAYKEAVDALRHGGMGFTVHILSNTVVQVLVTSADSFMGHNVCEHLLTETDVQATAAGVVREQMRDLQTLGALVVEYTLPNLAQLQRAMQDKHVVVIVPPADGESAQVTIKMMDAAMQANVHTILLMTVARGTAASNELGPRLADMQRMEQHLQSSQSSWAIVQNTFLQEDLCIFSRGIQATNQLGLPIGQGKFAPVRMSDVSAYVAHLIRHGDWDTGRGSLDADHDHQVHTLTGPESYDGPELVRLLSVSTGAEIKFRDEDRQRIADYLAHLTTLDISDREIMLEWFDLVKAGKVDVVTDTLERELERRARRFQGLCREWAPIFTPFRF